jgi:hypothetical protein
MTRYSKALLAVLFTTILVTSMAQAERYARIPAGTTLQVRVTEKLSSETATVGRKFHGSLVEPVVVDGRTVFRKGAPVTGEVVAVEPSGRLSRPGELHLALRTIKSGTHSYAVAVAPIVIKGESHTKSNVTKIGGGTAMGAIIGALVGGGKGAAIGAGAGAAAGTGAAAATGKKPAEVQSEAVLAWTTQSAQVGTASNTPTQQQPREQSDPEEWQRDAGTRDPEREYGNRDNYQSNEDRDAYYERRGPTGFSARERQIISECYVDNRAGLPPGLAKKDRLPPGLERQLQRNGTLPPGLQRRVQPLPEYCTERLPALPAGWERVVLSGRVILLDRQDVIVDLFWLDRD